MGFSGRLKDTLRRLRDLLDLPLVAENPDKEAKSWREEARELCYDLEDAIGQSSVTSRSSSAGEQAALDQLIQRAMAALSEFNNLSLLESNCVDPAEDQADASFLVGLEDPTKKIIELLDLPEKSDYIGHKVVSIVGLGGSGKSTLATQVFNKIAEKFHCKAHVFVTQKPDLKRILINLHRELGEKGHKAHNLDHLHELTLLRLIQEHVQGKRFLVLAEDICDENTWMVISSALLHNNSGGRIIMTTRINDIASLGDNVYHICPLSEENSKLLLLKRVLGSEVCPSNMEDPLEKILEKCGGLPLAIIAMSDVLKKENSPEHWKKSYNVMNSADTEDSIKTMRRKLSIDYYELPYHLRMCLLYLSIFPARHEIKRKRLVHGWIAQGLVQAKYGMNVAEQATGYFNELINRNWIEPVNIKNDGQARACRVHNAILDFILYKSAEEKFVTLLGSAGNKEKKIHNLSIQNMQDITQLGEVSHVRSLIIFGHFKQLPYPLKSDVLRVLDLEDCKPVADGSGDGNEPLVDASSFLQLRYLSIRSAGINGLREEEIAKMQYLEALDLRGSRVGEAQQLDITALQELVLLLVDSKTTLKVEIENLKVLEEVKYVSVSKHSEKFLKQLGQLATLRVLGIHLDAGETPDELKKALALVSSLHKLGNSNLHSLYIDGNWDISLNLSSNGDSGQPTLSSLQKLKIKKWCYFNEVPIWIASLNNLETLRLGVSQMMQDKLAILGALPCLVDLFLDILEVHGEEIIFEELMGFQYLKCLGISCRTRTKVTFGRNSVPCLEYLKLHIDIRDGVIPEGGKFVLGIEHLSSLTTFDVLIYCILKTDPVVKDVKDAMQKEAGDSVAIEFTEKPERTDTDEGALMSQVLHKFENLKKDQIQKLEIAQIDVKEVRGFLQDTRCFLMMLLDDENPKHQVKEWTNSVRMLCYSMDQSLSMDQLNMQFMIVTKNLERLRASRRYHAMRPPADDPHTLLEMFRATNKADSSSPPAPSPAKRSAAKYVVDMDANHWPTLSKTAKPTAKHAPSPDSSRPPDSSSSPVKPDRGAGGRGAQRNHGSGGGGWRDDGSGGSGRHHGGARGGGFGGRRRRGYDRFYRCPHPMGMGPYMRGAPPPPPPMAVAAPFMGPPPPPVSPMRGFGRPIHEMPSPMSPVSPMYYSTPHPPPEALRAMGLAPPMVDPPAYPYFQVLREQKPEPEPEPETEPQLNPEKTRAELLQQIEFYFSKDNLCRDVYLRQQMDDQGWVDISVIAGFKKVLNLTKDLQYIKEIVQSSSILEMQGDKIRTQNDWEIWVLPRGSNYDIRSSSASGAKP